jgi:hypothetical protein
MTDDTPFTGIKSFYGQDRIRRLLTLQDLGKICVETPEGTMALIYYAFLTNARLSATYAFGRLWLCLSDGTRPLDFPMIYDPVPSPNLPFLFGAVNISAPPLAPTAADTGTGVVTAGGHYFFYTFEDKYGFVTTQSPVGFWTAAGGKSVAFSGVSAGPGVGLSGYFGATVRRRIWMAPAYASGVAGFFNVGALCIEDNATTTLTANISDATLQTGVRWATDNQTIVPVPPALGVTKYADRLVYWGVYPAVEPRLAQRIDGLGSDILLLGNRIVDFASLVGWTTDFATAAAVHQSSPNQPIGTRTGNYLSLSGGGSQIHRDIPNLLTSYSADNQYWFKPGQRYGLLVRASGGQTGSTLNVTVKSGSLVLASAVLTLPPADVNGSSVWAVYGVDGVADVDAAPTTIRFQLQAQGNAAYVDWIRPYLQSNKFDGSTLWIGDNQVPQNFDLTKSLLPVAPGDWQEIRCCFEQTGNLYIVKEHSTWVTADNGQDPTTWGVDNVSFQMGTPSVHGVGLGPEFAIIAGREGIYRFDSGGINKISQEIETTWGGIDWTQGFRLWVTVDATLKVIRVGVPLKGRATGVCHVILKCDYSEGWAEPWQSEEESVSVAGSRKWTIDNVETICGEMAEKDDGSDNLLLGGASVSSNDLQDYKFAKDSAFGIWSQVGSRAATVTGGQDGPTGFDFASGIHPATKWSFPFSSGTAHYETTAAGSIAVGDYSTVSFWAKSGTLGSDVPLTVRHAGFPDASIIITSTWQRFVLVFGPSLASASRTLDLDFGTLTAPISVFLYGAQLQAGRFDHGWPGVMDGVSTPGMNNTGPGLRSGFLAEPIVYDPGSDPPWKTSDWNGIISPTYEIAPIIPTKFGRNIYDRVIARIRGAGTLTASYVLPDNTVKPMNGTSGQFPSLETSPSNDVELGGSVQGTYVGIRLQVSEPTGWFALKRLALFTKPHETNQYRGKS